MLKATYVLPTRGADPAGDEFADYLHWLRGQLEVIVVDGSPPEVFTENGERWPGITHVQPADDILCANGKVRGVLTGLRHASHERIIIADDDVRYDAESLREVLGGLKRAEVVRPQNYFAPLPWHAVWDTGRILLNRATGGDWPGTLAVRRSFLSEGYDGNCLFENLELVRTVRAAGGRELVARDVFVRRLPPTTSHFLSQRVRQAYDEWARPLRLAVQLSLLPAALWLGLRQPRVLTMAAAAAIGLAEWGRRREGGGRVFPIWTALAAPLWVTERAVCAWLAFASRIFLGGVRYHDGRIAAAATPQKVLDTRIAEPQPSTRVGSRSRAPAQSRSRGAARSRAAVRSGSPVAVQSPSRAAVQPRSRRLRAATKR
jgi:hypothetical protein